MLWRKAKKRFSRHFHDMKKDQGPTNPRKSLILLVGANRFELSTTRTPSECATRLRYAPITRVGSGFPSASS